MTEIHGEKFEIPDGLFYQPIHGMEEKGGRECGSRLELILEADRVFDDGRIKNSVIADIGCNFGWFLFEMERRGLGTSWIGVEREPEVVRLTRLISEKKQSKTRFFQEVDAEEMLAEVVLMLSVTHHLNMDYWFGKLARNKNVKTIYVEQATHMEYPAWASGLIPTNYDIPAFYWRKRFEQLTGGKFVCRIVGAVRTHLNTVRLLYQLKRKVSGKAGALMNFFEYSERWKIPYINGTEEKTEREYFRSLDGKEFLKIKGGKLFRMPWVEGVLLVDAFRWGLMPFFDLKRLRAGLKRECGLGGWDLRPHNLMVDENSEIHRIDMEDLKDGEDPAEIRREFEFFFNLI